MVSIKVINTSPVDKVIDTKGNNDVKDKSILHSRNSIILENVSNPVLEDIKSIVGLQVHRIN